VINTAQYFKSNKISNTDFSTLSTYLKWICEAMLIIKVPYYDVRGKKVLITSSKYYSSDLGLLSTKFGFGSFNFGWRIENLVFLELKNRYDFVYTHKTRNGKEIDFVCLKKNIVVYYQVCCANLREQDVYKREVHEFITDDSFKKIVLTMEQINEYDDNGVEIINILNWLNSKT
jgi:predicted AAA+ superfamily ATPase